MEAASRDSLCRQRVNKYVMIGPHTKYIKVAHNPIKIKI